MISKDLAHKLESRLEMLDNNVWLGIIHATSDVLNTGTEANLEGPLCSLMPFLNCTDLEIDIYDRFHVVTIKLIIKDYHGVLVSSMIG